MKTLIRVKIIKFIKEKLIKFIYIALCKIYNIFSTIIENFLYKRKKQVRYLQKSTCFQYDLQKINFEYLLNSSKKRVNKYLYLRKISDDDINKLLKSIFNEEFRNYITNISGFSYSIDYMIMYDRKYIKKEDRDQNTQDQWYSYKWHFDKPNSNNTLKIILPLNITDTEGPLLIVDGKTSKKISKFHKINESQISLKFIGNGNKVYGFLPALCIHKDGIPEKNFVATQVMFQLNPYYRWAINENLYNRQPQLNSKLKIWTNEPKFPLISYLYDKRKFI